MLKISMLMSDKIFFRENALVLNYQMYSRDEMQFSQMNISRFFGRKSVALKEILEFLFDFTCVSCGIDGGFLISTDSGVRLPRQD